MPTRPPSPGEAVFAAAGVTGYNEDVLSVYQYEIEGAADFELDT